MINAPVFRGESEDLPKRPRKGRIRDKLADILEKPSLISSPRSMERMLERMGEAYKSSVEQLETMGVLQEGGSLTLAEPVHCPSLAHGKERSRFKAAPWKMVADELRRNEQLRRAIAKLKTDEDGLPIILPDLRAGSFQRIALQANRQRHQEFLECLQAFFEKNHKLPSFIPYPTNVHFLPYDGWNHRWREDFEETFRPIGRNVDPIDVVERENVIEQLDPTGKIEAHTIPFDPSYLQITDPAELNALLAQRQKKRRVADGEFGNKGYLGVSFMDHDVPECTINMTMIEFYHYCQEYGLHVPALENFYGQLAIAGKYMNDATRAGDKLRGPSKGTCFIKLTPEEARVNRQFWSRAFTPATWLDAFIVDSKTPEWSKLINGEVLSGPHANELPGTLTLRSDSPLTSLNYRGGRREARLIFRDTPN